jgi:ACS family hexuronate transporter-like MFS transporter
MAAYALGMALSGAVLDWLGTRRTFSISVMVWIAAELLLGASFSVYSFGIFMFLLGIGEASNFPACIKTVAEWFPKRERALATGLFNAGANIGAIVAPLLVAFLVFHFGWRGAFRSGALLGAFWLCLWLLIYRNPESSNRVSQTELNLILSDPVEKVQRLPYARVIMHKETWAFAIGKFLTDGVWWFYLFWLPHYLSDVYHLDIKANRFPVLTVYAISTVGSIGGGYISAFLIGRGKSNNFARKTAMLICASLAVPVYFAPHVHNLWLVVALVGVAAAAHQGWSANLFTLPSDIFPKAAVGSVTGLGGMIGAGGGALMHVIVGKLAYSHNYTPLFAYACSAYLIAFAIVQTITPKLAPARMD